MAAVTEVLPRILTIPEPFHKLCRRQEGETTFVMLGVRPRPPPHSYASFSLRSLFAGAEADSAVRQPSRDIDMGITLMAIREFAVVR